jgi:arylsulfatase A-like enzyme
MIAAWLLLYGTIAPAPAAPPDILLVVTDDQRPDTIAALGCDGIRTPHLDRLVAGGTAFTRAYAGYPICHVSRAQLLTGCCAFRALPEYPRGAVDPALATLAGTFQSAGYHTVYSGKWHNDGHPRQRGYVDTSGLYSAGGGRELAQSQPAVDDRGRPITGYRGWTFKDGDNHAELDRGVGLLPDNSRRIADGAIAAMQSAPAGRPVLLHVNFAFPHDPRQWPAGMERAYAAEAIPLPANFAPQHPFDHGNAGGRDEVLLPRPLAPAAVREELALYRAMITDVDEQLGRILRALDETGRAERSIVIFTSDQGLALGSHGLLGKQNQYEHSIRSPLIICGPGLPRGRRSAALVNLTDLFPTLCDLAGVATPATVQGASLAPLLRGESRRVHEYTTGCFTDTQRMICDERWKLITYPQVNREQLFDLESDSEELTDLSGADEHRAVRDALRTRLDQWRRANGDPLAAGLAPTRAD